MKNIENQIKWLIKQVQCLKKNQSEGSGESDVDWLKQSDNSLPTNIEDNITTKGKVGINSTDEEYTLDVQQEAPVSKALTGTFSFDPTASFITGIDSQLLTEFDSNAQYLMPDGNIYPGSIFVLISDTNLFFFPNPSSGIPPAFTDEQISSVASVNSKIARIGDQFEVTTPHNRLPGVTTYGDTTRTALDPLKERITERIIARLISDEIMITGGGQRSVNYIESNNGGTSGTLYFQENFIKLSNLWNREIIANRSSGRAIRFNQAGNLSYINAPNANNDASYTKQVVAKTDGTIAFEDKSGGDYNFSVENQGRSLSKQLLSYNNTTGALCITIPLGTRSYTFKTLEYNFGIFNDETELTTYTVNGYNTGAASWFRPQVIKSGSNQRIVRLYGGSPDRTYRIYIGELTEKHQGQPRALFVDEILTISGTTEPNISLSIETSFQGTLQATF